MSREFTVIIPTWNMGGFLEPLTKSILKSDFAAIVEEILFVCEKSTDGSEQIIERLRQEQGERLPRIRLLQPEQRRGLFVGRLLGAKAAKTPKIFFIDSRITLPEASGRALVRLTKKYPAMAANVDIDTAKNIFCLYWRLSHNRFYRAESATAQALTITPENFTSTPVGCTCFYCSRDLFVRLSEGYLETAPLFNDDTFLMAEMVKTEAVTYDPQFRIQWEPRDQALDFLKHLYKRGPGLAQYHFFHHRGTLFYATLLAVLYGLAAIAFLPFHPLYTFTMLASALAAMALSTALIARSFTEFLRLAPLHTGVLIFYGFGALRGAWVVWKKLGFTNPTPAPNALRSGVKG